MKLLLISMAFFALTSNIAAQTHTAYKFVYTFHGDSVSHYNYLSTDTAADKVDVASISGHLINSPKKMNGKAGACLIYGNEEIVFCTRFPNGKFDTTIKPGPYVLSITSEDGLYNDINFNIEEGQHFNFNIHRSVLQSLDIYDIHSKRKLTKDEIEKIKKCVQGKNDLKGCAEKNVYFVAMEI